ncbi:alpha/beta hydrolase (plasmid) [Methylobacterium sp. NMS14P]|uniref:alpha/beta fold hydrolase n=1 Tax=Methylobacterium sp. NMS14P TaxID=2894310 RepID=UPI002359C55A|nr:alpha/beta fold hydrolase [Methylobacterium sp. NMS14P]WCS28473.1 alpha/beta hydrolase [Methylobacterium sp. NMS14P]
MPARAGFHVVAPDQHQRGYGSTTGRDGRDDGDAAAFRTHTYALDAVRIVYALGRRSAAAVGHDLGAMVAARWVQRAQPQRSNTAPLGFHRKPDSAP